jgi:Asp-tRNA(Asn)/Glu-tRNA(Gln) amidotransferase A subunit family amidase
LGIPALALPLISADGVPLGLKIAGFAGERAGLFV